MCINKCVCNSYGVEEFCCCGVWSAVSDAENGV